MSYTYDGFRVFLNTFNYKTFAIQLPKHHRFLTVVTQRNLFIIAFLCDRGFLKLHSYEILDGTIIKISDDFLLKDLSASNYRLVSQRVAAIDYHFGKAE